MGNELYQVLLPAEVKQWIKDSAKQLGISQGEFIRRAMEKSSGVPWLDAAVDKVTGVAAASSTVECLACGCDDATHAQAEWRVVNELAPRLRRKLPPRGEAEGPHEYIARYWAAPELARDFYRDLQVSLGWMKEDDGDQADYD